MNVVEAKDIQYSYTAEKEVLRGVSLTLEEGKYYCLVGHNGSGKSTLAKCLMGLILRFEGSISLFGIPLNAKNLRDIRSHVGIVFQNPDNQFVGSTVADDIAFGLENKCVPHEEMQGIIESFAEKTGMAGLLKQEPSALSGGQKQRVAIAGVLAMQPDLIILDEATSMLDPKGKKEILDLIHALRKERPHLTILSITHDVEEASRADEVIVLNKGKIFLQGKPEEVFIHREELSSIRLGLPFYYQLRFALEDRGMKIPSSVTDLHSLEAFLCQ